MSRRLRGRAATVIPMTAVLCALAFTLAFATLLGDSANASTTEPPAISDECRRIIGCADAGPEPEHPGDRGGYAQFLTLGALAGGVGFIMVKVVGAARASQPPRAE